MRLVGAAFALAVGMGYLLRGRLSNLGTIRIRWAPAALLGLGMQLAPWPGTVLPLAMLLVSFAVLAAFAAVNIRLGGFPLIAIGILCNFLVIGVNHGMPVTRHALVASDQSNTLRLLVRGGGAKHHLADGHDNLLFLGDVIPLGPIRQAVSVGDVFTYGGVMLLIVGAMRKAPAPAPALRPEVQHAGG